MEQVYRLIMENMLKGNIEKETAKSVLSELKAVSSKHEDIAIIGMASKFPKSDNIYQFWSNIEKGKELIRELPQKRKEDIEEYFRLSGKIYDKVTYQKEAYLDEVDKFDYNFFQITPKQASLMDPNQRVFMEIAFSAIQDAGYSESSVRGSRMGVFVGFSNDLRESYSGLMTDLKLEELEIAVAGNLSSIIPSRISYFLNLKGPSITLGTSCSSSLVAVHMACLSIINKECDTALVGSTKIDLLPVVSQYKMGMEASDGITKAFDERGNGTGFGEGVSAILLKPYSKAIADGDNIYAIIKGSAINQDGKTAGITVPNAEAQANVIVQAWKNARIDPQTITYIETHGTGTKLGDPIEIEGITNAFRKYTGLKQFCAIGSVKPNMGHLFEGAGLASLIKAVMALKNRKLPPEINFSVPNKRIDFCNTPVYVNDELREWVSNGGTRRCGVSSFGFSGTNCHLVLEEYMAPTPVKREHSGQESYVFTFSAKTRKSLLGIVTEYLNSMDLISHYDIRDVSFTNTVGREHYMYRIAFCVHDYEELRCKLETLVKSGPEGQDLKHIYYGVCEQRKQMKQEGSSKEVFLEERNLSSNKVDMILNSTAGMDNMPETKMTELLKLYVSGAVIDWTKLFKEGRYYRVSIPTYSFEKNRCWFLSESGVEEGDFTDNKRMYSQSRWIKTELNLEKTAMDSGKTIIIGSRENNEDLEKHFSNHNIDTETSCIEALLSESSDNIEEECRLLISRIEQNNISRVLVYIDDLYDDIGSFEKMQACVDKTIDFIFQLAKYYELCDFLDRPRLYYVAHNSWKVFEVDKISNPIHRAVYGFLKVVNKELGGGFVKSIDLDGLTKPEIWMKEIWDTKDDEAVAYRNQIRYTEIFDYMKMAVDENPKQVIDEGGTYVITGGLGALGLEVAKHIAKQQRTNIILINRSAICPRTEWDSVLENNTNVKAIRQIKGILNIEESGSRVMLYEGDTGSQKDMENVFIKIHKEFGRIRGVFHCAGVAGRGFLKHKEFRVYEEVIKPKIYGTWLLDHLTRDDKPDFIVLFSSEASLLALPGQSDYTAGNCFMDAYAEYRDKSNIIAVNWPAWKEIGLAKDNELTEDTVFKQISTRQGLNVLFDILGKRESRIIVGQWTENMLIRKTANISLSAEIEQSMSKNKENWKKPEKRLKKVNLVGRDSGQYSKNEQLIANAWGEVLGFTKINIHDSFYDLGGDSIQALRLAKELTYHLQLNIGVSEILKLTSVVELAQHLDQNSDNPHIQEIEKLRDGLRYYETSSAQKRLYVLNTIEGGTTNYNLPQGYRIEGQLDIGQLKKAIQELVKRHEIMRTTFNIVEGELMQEVKELFDIQITEVESSEERIKTDMEQCIKKFDLSSLPLFRVYLLRTLAATYMVVDMHHIIVDGGSEAVLISELTDLYNERDLEPLKYQYKDFANWQNQLQKVGKLENQKNYWLKKLNGNIPILDLPYDYKRKKMIDYQGNTVSFKLPERTCHKLRHFASKKDGTLFMVMVAVYKILLFKYSGQEDILVGTPVVGRQNSAFNNNIGLFINTLVIRSFVTGKMTFDEFYQETKKNILEAIENQDYPLDAMIGELNLKRDLSRNPLFDTMFSMLNMERNSISIDGIDLSDIKLANRTSKFDLTVEVEDLKDEIIFNLEYKTSLFSEETIDQMYHSFISIADSIDNESTISEIPIINQASVQILLNTVNNTALDYDREKNIADLIEDTVRRFPHAQALEYKEYRISYDLLNKRANQIARMLLDKNVKTGSRIAILMKRDEYLLEVIFAILKIGAVYIPIDPAYPKERVEFILKDSFTDIIIANTEVEDYASKENLEIIDVRVEDISRYGDENLNLSFSSECDAYIIYTSGSTGNPKGVRISNRAVNNFIYGMTDQIDFSMGKSILILTTISFDIFVLESLLPLAVGMKMVLADEYQQLDSEALGRLIKESNIDMLQMTPSRANMLIKYCGDSSVLNKVQEIMLGGETVPLQLVNQIKTMTNSKIYNMYGPTETTVWSSVSELTNKDIIDVGRPIANTQMYIVNEKHMLQPPGIAGELCIAGEGLSNGYLNREDLNQNSFIDNPFYPGRKMYRTGDLASFNHDLTINILGRMDTQVKLRGYRIELEEIETQILRYEGIKEAVAAVKGEEESEKHLVVYYTADKDIDPEHIRKFLSRNLIEYMIPSYYVRLYEIPSLPNGKTDRKGLSEIKIDNQEKKMKVTGLSDGFEENIFKVWTEVLGRKDFEKEDNFFDVGGNSILLIKMHSLINKIYPQKLTVTDLFEFTTVKSIAGFIRGQFKSTIAGGQYKETSSEGNRKDDIAVVGISSILPGGKDVIGFWEELCRGRDFIDEMDSDRRSDVLQYVNFANRQWNQIIEHNGLLRGAYLQDIDKFDHGFFRISPREASLMDPNQRLLLQTIWGAIEDAGYGDGSLYGSKTGIYIGNSDDFGVNYRRMLEADKNAHDGIAVPGNVKSIMASRISYLMDFKGPSLVIDTACSSSLVAVDLACRDIREGKCSQAIIGASNIVLLPLITKQKIGIESSDGHTKAFDDRSDGTGLGEGVIAVMLKPLKEAVKDNDHIYAVVKGGAVNQDGNSIGLTAPNANAQQEALIEACEAADISADTLGYIEAHGTGTKLGDPIEIQGITKALRHYTDRKQFCAIGSLKTNIGHLDNCAGLAGFLKAVLILNNRMLPPTLHFDIPNRKIPLEASPVYVNDILREWKSDGKPRRCAVNSFGLSGTNCCIILEEGPEYLETRPKKESNQALFTLSAMTQWSLIDLVKKYITYLELDYDDYLEDICYTANTGRKDYKFRLAFVIKDKEELLNCLKEYYCMHSISVE